MPGRQLDEGQLDGNSGDRAHRVLAPAVRNAAKWGATLSQCTRVVVARRHRRARGVPMEARRRVVHAVKDARHFFVLLLGFRLQVIQDGLFLLPSLLRRRAPEEGALGRVRRRRGRPLAVLAVLLPPRVAGGGAAEEAQFRRRRRLRVFRAPEERELRRRRVLGSQGEEGEQGPPWPSYYGARHACRVRASFRWMSRRLAFLEQRLRARGCLFARVPVGLGAACKTSWGKRCCPESSAPGARVARVVRAGWQRGSCLLVSYKTASHARLVPAFSKAAPPYRALIARRSISQPWISSRP